MICVLPAVLSAQNPVIGVIDFYGLRTVSQAKVREVLGVSEGGALPRSRVNTEEALEDLPGIVRARLQAACCEDGEAILYVGIEEKGAAYYSFHATPEEMVLLPDEVHDTYVHFLSALGQAVRDKDTAENLTNGHSLMANADCRAHQEKFLEFAAERIDNLRDVLRNSYNEEHRAISAYVIGYSPDKTKVVADLLYALRDPDETVRDNAMRALAAIEVLAKLKPSLGIKIPPTWLIEMLNSLVWTDRTVAAANLVNLTEQRDQEVLTQLNERALPSLIDMAKWKHLPHSLPSFILLGRTLGMEEGAIQQAWQREEDREKLIAEAIELAAGGKQKKR
ncbi:MAG: HEAT repeat domain-containing protein [bacterium]|nr:HEAT repeat domain-containing protein [bacterium]